MTGLSLKSRRADGANQESTGTGGPTWASHLPVQSQAQFPDAPRSAEGSYRMPFPAENNDFLWSVYLTIFPMPTSVFAEKSLGDSSSLCDFKED